MMSQWPESDEWRLKSALKWYRERRSSKLRAMAHHADRLREMLRDKRAVIEGRRIFMPPDFKAGEWDEASWHMNQLLDARHEIVELGPLAAVLR